MKNLLIILPLLLPAFLAAQKTITWNGGTPGKPSCWNEPRNWDANRVPEPTDHVIIRLESDGVYAQPVIRGEVHIASIEIQAGAELSVSTSGKLVIDGEYTYSEGISIYGGKLKSDGEIILKDIEPEYLRDCEPVALSQAVVYYSTRYDYQFSVVTSR